jgi:hypothetical protein
MEMTAPYKPQMNGVVERSFVTARNRAFAMMISARRSSSFQNRPWAEAVHTAPKNVSILHSSRHPISPHMMFFGVESKITASLKPFFVRVPYITNRSNFHSTFSAKFKKCAPLSYLYLC